MSPHAVRGTGTCHTVETVERGWEENCLGDELPHYETQENASCTYATLRYATVYNPQACGVPTHVSPPLTSRGTQVLFVVNSIKLHLTAFISNELQPASEDNCFFVRTVSTDHVKSWRKRRGNLDLSQNDLRSQM